MSNNQKWVKELSDFFAKDENWDIACETIEAVEQVETYWKEQFWLNVCQQSCDQLDEDLWEVRKEGEQVDIYPKHDKGSVEERCCISIACDKEDGCWYGVWISSECDSVEFAKFFEGQGLVKGEDMFYRPQVVQYLDRAQLGKEAKSNYANTKKLVQETVQFMQDPNVRDMMLGVENK